MIVASKTQRVEAKLYFNHDALAEDNHEERLSWTMSSSLLTSSMCSSWAIFVVQLSYGLWP